MHVKTIAVLVVSGALVAGAAAAQHRMAMSDLGGAQAAAPSAQTTTPAAPGAQANDSMMAQMQKADAELDALVAKMNATTGPAKTDAVAAVINALVTQRKHMREMMKTMPGMGMMPGMPMMQGRMGPGMMPMRPGMPMGQMPAGCPMMGGMTGGQPPAKP